MGPVIVGQRLTEVDPYGRVSLFEAGELRPKMSGPNVDWSRSSRPIMNKNSFIITSNDYGVLRW